MADLTLITPTADQPTGIALCERWMKRQSLWGQLDIQWIVADDGAQPAELTMGQQHVYHRYSGAHPPGYYSLIENMSRALPLVDSPIVTMIEHDDWYSAGHLAFFYTKMMEDPNLLATGDPIQRYYHVRRRLWRKLKNVGACLSQTTFRASAIPLLWRAIGEAECRRSYGIDRFFWNRVIARKRDGLFRSGTVIGIKGLPGRLGIGEGHRPKKGWGSDPQADVLRRWVGTDAPIYEQFAQ